MFNKIEFENTPVEDITDTLFYQITIIFWQFSINIT